MPKGYPPSVFVSSTCYDLNQVRADLKRFLDSMGFEPILSETPAFPVNPQVGTVENCILAVKDRADIFVLIVGARYGSQLESGKSITNLEYVEAKAKGVPIYVFVLKQILHILPVWKKNQQGDYKDVVDTPKLLEFVEGLRDSKDHWVFEFEEVAHIIETLRHQLAVLFMDSLILRERLKDLKLPPALIELSGNSLRLVIERPFGWEYRLFSSVLADELKRNQGLKWDLKYKVRVKSIHLLDDITSVMNWLLQKLSDIEALVESSGKLMNAAIQEAVGASGIAGDPEHIVYVARRMGEIHKSVLEWSIEFNCTKVPPECERLLSLVSDFSNNVVEEFEKVPSGLAEIVTKAEEAHKRNEKYTAELKITLSIPPNREITAESEKLSRMISERSHSSGS